MGVSRRSRLLQAAVLAASPVALTAVARGQAVFQSASSSVTYTHYVAWRLGGMPVSPAYTQTPAQMVTLPTSPNYDFNNTLNYTAVSHTASTSASTMSMVGVGNGTTAGVNIETGSGLTQNDSGGSIAAANGGTATQSELEISFNLHWTVGLNGLTATAASVSFPMLAAGGADDTFQVSSTNLAFTVGGQAAQVMTVSPTLLSPGLYQVATSPIALNGGVKLTEGMTLALTGILDLRAKDDTPAALTLLGGGVSVGSPTDMSAISGTGNWSAATSWTSDGLAPAVPGLTSSSFPVAAKFEANTATPTPMTMSLDVPVTISELDFSDEALDTIAQGGANDITFDPNFAAVIHVDDYSGGPGAVLNVPVTAAGSGGLQLDVNGNSTLTLNSAVTASGIIKTGSGTVQLNAANTITNTSIQGGSVQANVAGALGATSVSTGGHVGYNANGAATGTVTAQQDGEVVLGVTPGGSDSFSVQSGGAISGSPTQLAALNVGAGGNLALAPGAMIAHSTLSGSDPSGLGSTPQYEFGLNSSFTAGSFVSMTVGSMTSSPWIGFGGDQSNVTFGSSANGSDFLTIAGNADLVSLQGGSILINAQLAGTGSITKVGGGTVILNHAGTSGFTGSVTISAGTLQIGNGGTTGALPALSTLTDNGNLSFDHSDTVNCSIALSGSGGVTQMGSGTLVLSHANTFSGGVTVASGILSAGASGSLGTGGAFVGVGGTLDLNGHSASLTSLSGGGSVVNLASLTAVNLTVNNGADCQFDGTIGGGPGTLALVKSGSGTLTLTGNNTFTGSTIINAGTLVLGAPGALPAGGTVINSAVLQVNTLTAAGNVSGSGTTIVAAGGALVAANFTQAGGLVNNGNTTIAGNGTVGPISGTGNLTIGINGTSTNVLTLAPGSGLSAVNALTILGSAALNVNNNHMIINYGTNGDPATSIRAYLASGYNGGGWNGTGLISTAAHNQNTTGGLKYALGYADGADGIVAGLPAGQIEVKCTLVGDLDLNSVVNGTDFSLLSGSFGHVQRAWDLGDLDYNNVVNGTDFSAMSQNFGHSATGVAVALSSADWAAFDAFAADHGLTTAVPEPASLTVLTMGGLSLMSRRKRRANLPN